MKVEYNNLYTHFVFTTLHGLPLIVDAHRERIEKYITGIVKNNESHLYAIYRKHSYMEEYEAFIKFYQKDNQSKIR
ncbi:MAG: hypothetical protein Q8R96_02855 [Bacteroidota bacterium]|nr:hypothetical protein [Bacteroidota bacterium]